MIRSVKDRTIEKADVDTSVANAGGQGFPDQEVGICCIFQVSGGGERPVSGCAQGLC